MPLQTFIFIGRSGSGKGTQAKLLKDYLKKEDPSREVFYLQSGEKFRKFIDGNGYSNKLSRDIYDAGDLQPEFLSAWLWADALVKELEPDQHLILDGTPRRPDEAKILDTALIDFYKRGKPLVLFVDVSEEWGKDRLRDRGRKDDLDPEQVKKRMAWYLTDVVPTIEHFKESAHYEFAKINGEQTIEEVHKEILSHLKGA